MKKIIAIILSFIFISLQAAKAEVGIGITGAVHYFQADGTETTRSSNEKNTGSHDEAVLVPELFIEAVTDSGTIGLSYIPTKEVGSESRKDTSTSGDSQDTGTYKAEAELDNVIQVYADLPMTEMMGYPIHLKLGIQHATLATLESLNSGSSYPDQDLLGYTIGFGTKGDLAYGNNLYYKAEATYTAFEDYEADSDSSPANRVEAEIEDIAVKFSIGYKF
tara:strand:+ start:2052 stop:2711 length:660 start_codon:yes stop_codon:yes gene_type:complete